MLVGRLGNFFKTVFVEDQYVTLLYGYLRKYKECLEISLVIGEAREEYEKFRKAEQLTKLEDQIRKKVVDTMESYDQLAQKEHLSGEAAFARIKEEFQKAVQVREEAADAAMRALEYAFEFMEAAFGDSQEMVSFVTELNTNYYSIQFLKDNDCAKYYQYNKKLLFEEQHQEIMTELDEIEQDLNTAVK